MAYKCANNLAPDYLCIEFKKRSAVHDRTTRNNNKLHIPLFKTCSGQRTFAYQHKIIVNKRQSMTAVATALFF